MEGRFAIGPAWILSRRNDTGTGGGISLEDAFERESRRLKAFIEGSPVPEVFSAHLEMLEDQMLRDTIRRNMLEGMTARSAVEAAAQEICASFGLHYTADYIYDYVIRTSVGTLLEQAAEGGFMSRNCLKLFAVCDTPEQALSHVLRAETLRGSVRRLADYQK